jgi:soluble lytic murein transglycosylase
MFRREWFRTNWRVLATVAMAAAVAVSLTAQADPASDLKSAVAALQSRPATALATLRPMVRSLPRIADYIAWFTANAEFNLENYSSVPQLLEPVWAQSPASPLEGRAAMLGSQAYQMSGDPQDALNLLRKHYAALAQPAGDLAMAKAFAAAGDSVSATIYAQRVYYGYPMANEANDAGSMLTTLRGQLNDRYPPAMGDAMLGRAKKILDSGNIAKARAEFAELLSQLGGAERDVAQVKLGVAQYLAKDTRGAQKYLKDLVVATPDADAERLQYLLLCARRADDRAAMHEALDQLARLYPDSPWRLEALIAVANSYLVENQPSDYEPLYRACYESFPNEPRAAVCHWKVAWSHYLRRQNDAGDLLREQLRLFPNSDDSPAALYFLARLAEGADDPASARTYYNEILREYPNYFYTTLARERLADMRELVATSVSARDFLRTVDFKTRARVRDFVPNAASRIRIERAQLLAAAGLDDWAETELRYAAQNEDQPHVMGLELARMASLRGAQDQAIRYLKRYTPDYLSLPMDSAPAMFWKLAFPLPYRSTLERYARQNDLDPFLMAALARQESEFNPKAISAANARGLTQILPSTGRELSRRLHIPYSTARLFQPQTNLQLGSYYMRTVADNLGGRWEAALAAYNAGLSRAQAWSKWGGFREPAEFVETVPFSQTRNYIQIVLRNADIYRRLYAKSAVAEPAPKVSYSDGIDQRKKSSRPAGAR